MKMKRLLSAICAAAVTLSAVGGLPAMAEAGAEEEIALFSETGGTLSAPTNVREENGFIVWDEVADAYGYTVRTFNGTEELQQTYYENKAEWKRFIYDCATLDFADYTFDVCAFDESRNNSAWSSKVTVSYAPTLEAPENIRPGEEQNTIVWDEADGAARYNIRFYNPDGTLYTWSYTSGNSLWYANWCDADGEYQIKVQTMDRNYNVSDWSEITVSYHAVSEFEAPKNVRLDESGDYILWDAVEGAEIYGVSVMNVIEPLGGGYNQITYVNAPQCQSEWKFLVSPFASSKHEIWVMSPNGKGSWNSSDSIEANFTPTFDETLIIPAELKLENGNIEWDEVEGAAAYWTRISAYGNFFGGNNGEIGTNAQALYNTDQFPAGTYNVETYAVRQNGNYNGRKHSLTLNTIPDDSVWIPKLYYKFDELIWDWDRLRHENTNHFWLRFSQSDVVVKLEQTYWNEFYGLPDLSDGEYTVEICATENWKTGKWSEPLLLVKHGEGLFDKENETTTEIEPTPDSEKIPESDRITSITINPAFNMKNKNDSNVELDLTKIKIKAQEIYDEAGLKRAEEALGEEIIGNKHYNLLDLTLLYNDQDFSNGYDGLVQVIIPLPTGHRDKTFSCYRLIEVNGEMTKEVIPGEQTEDSYIIYLEHFSEYALVADGGEEPHTHTFSTEWKSDSSSHWHECACGEKSELTAHTENSGVITTAPTTEATGVKTYSCTVCGYAMRTETVDKLEPSKQGFYSDGLSILTAEIGTTVTQKTEVKDGTYNIRFIEKVNAESLTGKSKATFTLTANGVTKEVSTAKYYTGLTFDDGTKATAASGQVFLCYTVTGVPENVTVEATSVVLE